MMDKITGGTVVAGTVGFIFGVMLDAAFLQPLHDPVSFREKVHPKPRYITRFELECLTNPQAGVQEFPNYVPRVCVRGGNPIRILQATQ